jgi:SAM-dependent methyltransferase
LGARRNPDANSFKIIQRGAMSFKWVNRHSCPVCSGEGSKEVRRMSFSDPRIWSFLSRYYQGRLTLEMVQDAEYVVKRCPSCTLYFQATVLDEHGLMQLYETIIDPVASLDKRRLGSHAFFENLRNSVACIRQFFPNRRPSDIRVLDFGMGWGHWAAMARTHGFDVSGAELSAPRIEYARRQFGIPVVENVLADGRPASFDFINTDQVFEHLAQPLEILRLLSSLLLPGGILKIYVPTGLIAQRHIRQPKWKASKDALHPLEHINSFTPQSVTHLAAAAGLRRLGLADVPLWKDRIRIAPGCLKAKITPSWYFVKG